MRYVPLLILDYRSYHRSGALPVDSLCDVDYPGCRYRLPRFTRLAFPTWRCAVLVLLFIPLLPHTFLPDVRLFTFYGFPTFGYFIYPSYFPHPVQLVVQLIMRRSR